MEVIFFNRHVICNLYCYFETIIIIISAASGETDRQLHGVWRRSLCSGHSQRNDQ